MPPTTTVCKTCHTPFTAYRKTAVYCSDKCRYHQHLRTKKRITVPNDVRFTILRRDGFRCRYCGEPGGAHPQGEGRTLMVDHIVSLDEGGAMMDLNNCITSCRACNLGKGKRSLDLSEVPPLVDA